jgi:hypothetical protein
MAEGIGSVTLTIAGLGNALETVVFNTDVNGAIIGVDSSTGSNIHITDVLNSFSATQNSQVNTTVNGQNVTYTFINTVTGNANVASWSNKLTTGSRVALLGNNPLELFVLTVGANNSFTVLRHALTVNGGGLITGVAVGIAAPLIVVTLAGDICVRAGALVLADQGHVLIEELNPKKHTMRGGQRIVAVTKTKALNNKHLVLFKTHALGFNVPACDTYLTMGHKVQGVEAQVWAKRNMSIMLVDYQPDEYLYNVLLETYGVMTVNNMVIETLHPSNPIAKLYL